MRLWFIALFISLSFLGFGQDLDTPTWSKFWVNGQKHTFDQVYVPANNPNYGGYNVLKNITRGIRYFHQMEDDYDNVNGRAPATNEMAYGGYNVNDSKFANLPVGGFATEPYDRAHATPLIRLLNGIRDSFEIQATLMVFSNNGIYAKGFPNRMWHINEVGNLDSIAKYAYGIAALWDREAKAENVYISPVLELTNEAWGSITKAGVRRWYKGFFQGLTKYYGNGNKAFWGFDLAAGAFQAHDASDVWGNQANGEGDYLPSIFTTTTIWDTLTYATAHPYAFTDGTISLVEHPESATGEFRYYQDIRNYLVSINKANVKLMVTEFGWDSGTVGQQTQGVYLTRGFLMLAANDWIERIMWYEDVDNPNLGTGNYSSSGLLTNDAGAARKQGSAKAAYKYALQLKNALGDAKIIAKIQENTTAYCYLAQKSNGDSLLITWRPVNVNNDATPDDPQAVSVNSSLSFTLGDMYKIDGDIGLDAVLNSTSKGIAYNGASRYGEGTASTFVIEASPVVYIYEVGSGTVIPPGGGSGGGNPIAISTNGTAQKAFSGRLTNITNVVGATPSYRFTANLLSEQYTADSLSVGQLITANYQKEQVILRVDTFYNVVNQSATIEATLIGDASFNLATLPTASVKISEATTDGLILDATGTNESARVRTYNHNIIIIQAAIDSLREQVVGSGSVGTGTPNTVLGYDGTGQSVALELGAGLENTGTVLQTSGLVENFTDLNDVFTYSGTGNRLVQVNSGATALGTLNLFTGAVPYGIAGGGVSFDNANRFTYSPTDSLLTLRGNGLEVRTQATRSMRLVNYNSTGFYSPEIIFEAYEGNFATPAVVRQSKRLGGMIFRGWDGTNLANSALITATANQNFTSTARGSRLTFQTTTNGQATPATRLELAHNGDITMSDYGDNLKTTGTLTTIPYFDANGRISEVIYRKGTVTATTDASGDITITHNNNAGTTYQVRAQYIGTVNVNVTVHTKTATSFKIRFFNTAGTAIASASQTVDWELIN